MFNKLIKSSYPGFKGLMSRFNTVTNTCPYLNGVQKSL